MVKGGRFPDSRRSILRQDFIQSMRAERAERHGQKPGDGRNAGGGCVGHKGNEHGTGIWPVKFNNWCSFAFIRA
jgi:hypothetical protein